jgi:hypothetical protein
MLSPLVMSKRLEGFKSLQVTNIYTRLQASYSMGVTGPELACCANAAHQHKAIFFMMCLLVTWLSVVVPVTRNVPAFAG